MFAHAFFKFLLATACLTASSLFLYRPSVIIHQAEDDFALSIQSVPEAGRGGVATLNDGNGDAVPSSVHWANGSEFFPAKGHAALPAGRPTPLRQIQHTPGSKWRQEEEVEALAGGFDISDARERVKAAFLRSWTSYKERALGKDELLPISGNGSNIMNGWAVTFIETLDALWIMDLKEDFGIAVSAMEAIDFTMLSHREIAVQDATSRCLGGLLGAYEVSAGEYPVLLEKAKELGDVLLGAFDTPNRMPINFFDWTPESTTKPHRASSGSKLMELGSMSLEFTKLSQLTGDTKYFDAVNRVLKALAALQTRTSVPGLWPAFVDASGCKRSPRSGNSCTVNGLAPSALAKEELYSMGDGATSVYTSLLKQSLLLGGQGNIAETMHAKALNSMEKKLMFKPLIGGLPDVLMIGDRILDRNASWYRYDHTVFEPRMSRSACALAAMFAVGAAVRDKPGEIDLARKLTDGCIWAHGTSRSGLMPAEFTLMSCSNQKHCKWEVDEYHTWWNHLDLRLHDDFDPDEYVVRETPGNSSVSSDGIDSSKGTVEEEAQDSRRHSPLQSQTITRPTPFLAHEDFVRLRIWNEGLAEGMLDIHDRTYDLGPEVIESVFTMYRVTGEARWREAGLKIFESIEKMTATKFGNAKLLDTTKDEHEKVLDDLMPSYWMGATLKYYWLLFAEDTTLSLGEWVFTAGGHPLRLPR